MLYNTIADGGNDIDILLGYDLFSLAEDWYYDEFYYKDLSDGLQHGNISNVEILIKEMNITSSSFFHSSIRNKSIKDWLYSDSDHQIILNEDTNTITLGSGWSYMANSETGTGAWHTKSYIYTDSEGRIYTLETTLDVTNIESTPNEYNPHRPILSGHEAELEGQLDFSFGADAGAGAKLSVFANGEEFTLAPAQVNTVPGRFGTLTIAANGIFSYKAKPNVEGTDEFQFQITDSDGDIISTDVNGNPLKILVDVEMPEFEARDISFAESKDEQSHSLEIAGYKIIAISMDSDIASLQNNNYVVKGGAGSQSA